MNPHHLELFYYVAKSKGVSRAVREMSYGIQQPSVSAQVNALERDLGVTLYQRRPFKLTPAGEELYRFVEPFFGRIPEIRARLKGAAQIRIGASPIVFRDYLPPVLEALRKKCPELNMILRALNQPELIASLEHDELDLVISLIPDNLSPRSLRGRHRSTADHPLAVEIQQDQKRERIMGEPARAHPPDLPESK